MDEEPAQSPADSPAPSPEVSERLALALDVDDLVAAVRLARRLQGHFGVAKIGLELFAAAGPEVITAVADLGYRIFLDLKLHDIPTTVHKAARVIGAYGVQYLTAHALGGTDMLRGAVEGLEEGAAGVDVDRPSLLAITVLTSHAPAPPDVMAARLETAAEARCQGIVCAVGALAEARRSQPALFKVTPGIRLPGDAANDDPACFWQADVAEAAERLAAILREEGADILTCYDHNGGYGHPDHIQVHRVGVKAAEFAGVGVVYESTLDRQHFQAAMHRLSQIAAEAGLDMGSDEEQAETTAELESESFGSDAADITHRIDVTEALDEKRRAMLAHSSQIPADSFFVALPDEAFALMSATEWFILRGAARRDPPEHDIFATLRR